MESLASEPSDIRNQSHTHFDRKELIYGCLMDESATDNYSTAASDGELSDQTLDISQEGQYNEVSNSQQSALNHLTLTDAAQSKSRIVGSVISQLSEMDSSFSNSQNSNKESQHNVVESDIEIKQEIKDEPTDDYEHGINYEFVDFGPLNDSLESEESNMEDDAPIYPSEDNVQQNDFFGAFGLVKKSDVPTDNPNQTKLHRNRGGKLRRHLKPRVHQDMMTYGSSYIGKGKAQSFRENSPKKSAPNWNNPDEVSQTRPVSVRLTRLSPHVTDAYQTAIKEECDDDSTILQGHDSSEPTFSVKNKLRTQSQKKNKFAVEKILVAHAPALHPQLMTSVARSPMRTLAKMSEIKNREKKGLPLDGFIKQVERLNRKDKSVKIYDEDAISRRSSRLQGKQKKWKHLLKHNPDAYEKPSGIERVQIEDSGRRRFPNRPKKPYYAQHSDKYSNRDHYDDREGEDPEDIESYIKLYEEASKSNQKVRSHKNVGLINKVMETETRQKTIRNIEAAKNALTSIPKDLPGHYPALHGVASTMASTRPKRITAKQRRWHTKSSDTRDHCSGSTKPISSSSKTDTAVSEMCPPPDDVSFSPKKREPNSFMDILKEREAEQKDVLPSITNHVPVYLGPPIIKHALSAEACLVPHMCTFCWINDHMYCKTMKRNEHDIKPHGECLHFRACEHYSHRQRAQKSIAEEYSNLRRTCVQHNTKLNVLKLQHDPKNEENEVDILGEHEVEVLAPATEEDLSLECSEQFECSDTESAIPPRGTELLSAHIIARQHFIKHSLSTEIMPSFQPITYLPSEPLSPPVLHNVQPYIARHAAEIIVASENTWYYPPKHLDSLLKRHSQSIVPTQTWLNMMKSVDVKQVIAQDVTQKWMKNMQDAKSQQSSEHHINKPNLMKVRVRKVDGQQILIQQIEQTGDAVRVLNETVLHMNEELKKASRNDGSPHQHADTRIIGDLIAREALNLVGDARQKTSTEKEEKGSVLSSTLVNEKLKDVVAKIQQEQSSQSVIDVKANTFKTRFNLLYSRNKGQSVNADLKDSEVEANKILHEINLLKQSSTRRASIDLSVNCNSATHDDSQPLNTGVTILDNSQSTNLEQLQLHQSGCDSATADDRADRAADDSADRDQKKSDSQTLSFTTKDIREKDPKLIDYIRKAHLAPVISSKLNQEKDSLRKMIKTVEDSIARQTQYMESKKSEQVRRENTRRQLLSRQKCLSQSIIDAVNESTHIARNKLDVETHTQELREELQLLRKVRTQCRSMQRDRGEISASQQPDHDYMSPQSKQQAFVACAVVSKKLGLTLHPIRTDSTGIIFSPNDKMVADDETSRRLLEAINTELLNNLSSSAHIVNVISEQLARQQQNQGTTPAIIRPAEAATTARAETASISHVAAAPANKRQLTEQILSQISSALKGSHLVHDESQIEMSVEFASADTSSPETFAPQVTAPSPHITCTKLPSVQLARKRGASISSEEWMSKVQKLSDSRESQATLVSDSTLPETRKVRIVYSPLDIASNRTMKEVTARIDVVKGAFHSKDTSKSVVSCVQAAEDKT